MHYRSHGSQREGGTVVRQKTSPGERGALSKEVLTRRGVVSMALHVLPARRMQILGVSMSAANLMVSERGAVTLSPLRLPLPVSDAVVHASPAPTECVRSHDPRPSAGAQGRVTHQRVKAGGDSRLGGGQLLPPRPPRPPRDGGLPVQPQH